MNPYMMIAGQVLQGLQEYRGSQAEEGVARAQARLDKRSLEVQMERERTQAALEARDREDRLSRALARTRAAFGASGVEIGSGTPLRLQERQVSETNREQAIDDLNTSQNLLTARINREQIGFGLRAEKQAFRSSRRRILGGVIGNSYNIYKEGNDG